MKIVVTGANGLVGRQAFNKLKACGHSVIGLDRSREPSDRLKVCEPIPAAEFAEVDIVNAADVLRAIDGMDVVVHMAAEPDGDAPFQLVLNSNVIGTKNIVAACIAHGVKRLILASSNMVSWGYWLYEHPYCDIREGKFDVVDAQNIPLIRHDSPVRPTTDYAASKLWGEALARSACDQHNLSCICLRFGAVNVEDDPIDRSWGSIWLAKDDAAELVRCCVDAPPEVRFETFYASSNSRLRWVDVSRARERVGWEPKANSDDILEARK